MANSGNAQADDIEDPIKLKEDDKPSKIIRFMVSNCLLVIR